MFFSYNIKTLPDLYVVVKRDFKSYAVEKNPHYVESNPLKPAMVKAMQLATKARMALPN